MIPKDLSERTEKRLRMAIRNDSNAWAEEYVEDVTALKFALQKVVAQRDALREAAHDLVKYRQNNSINFQLEKADDYIRLLESTLSAIHDQ